jgi:hypothetical protein
MPKLHRWTRQTAAKCDFDRGQEEANAAIRLTSITRCVSGNKCSDSEKPYPNAVRLMSLWSGGFPILWMIGRPSLRKSLWTAFVQWPLAMHIECFYRFSVVEYLTIRRVTGCWRKGN